MKKILSKLMCMLIMVVMAFSLFACGSPQNDDGNKHRKAIATLAENGESDYRVLIAADADIVEQTAASELVKYIQLTTGASLSIVTDAVASTSVNGKYLSVGENKLFEKAKINNKNLNEEGYVLKTVGNTLFIVGQIPKATLFGVYGFLEYEMGCKFLTAQYEYIPQYQKFELKETNERSIPAIAHRTVFSDAVITGTSMYLGPKNRYSVARTANATPIGGLFWTFTGYDAIHSMRKFISMEEYKELHPQWFGTAQSYMPCLSNGLNIDTGEIDPADWEKDENGNPVEGTTYIEAYINKCIEQLEDGYTGTYITLGQPDSSAAIVCNCDKCKAQLEKLDHNRSAQFMIWANTVAKYVQTWVQENQPWRTLRFARTAYSWTEGAPVVETSKGIYKPITEQCRPRDDMSIWWIPINGCFIHDICDGTCGVNSNGSGASWEKWKQICDDFLVFDYNINYTQYLAYFPNMNVLQPNIQEYVEQGVSAYLLEGSMGSCYFYQQDMEAWVASKLMWNPYQDVVALVSEFNRYYYGETAGKIADELLWFLQGHFNYQAKEQSELEGTMKCTSVYSGSQKWMVSDITFNKLFLNSCYKYIARMREAYKNDETLTMTEKLQYEENVQRFEVMIDFMKYHHYDTVTRGSDSNKYQFMTQFFDKLEMLDIKKLSETSKTVSEIRMSLGY